MNQRIKYRAMIAACLLTLVLILGGCARKIVNDNQAFNVKVALSAKLLSPQAMNAVDHFELLVEASDFGSMLIPMTLENGYIVAEANVPVGTGRRFVASAYDKNDVLLYRGETTIDIMPGMENTLDIDLMPVAPMVNITPHYQNVMMNDSFYVDISVFNVPYITSITIEFTYNYAPAELMSVVKGAAYGDSVDVYYYPSDAYYTYEIEIYAANETGYIVGASGYANLATVGFRSYRDWGFDTATVVMQITPTYLYSASGTPFPVDSIFSDGAKVELYADTTAQVSSWEKTLGGAADDICYSACQAHDGNLIVAGTTSSSGYGLDDVYLAKVDLDGNLAWEKTFGGSGGDVGFCVAPVDDGGYIIAGSSDSFSSDGMEDVYLVKTDALGNFDWQKTYAFGSIESGHSVVQTSDGGFVVAGTSSQPGGSLVYVLKTGPQGDSVWAKTYAVDQFNTGRAVVIAQDNNYVVAGSATTIDFSSDMLMFFVDDLGRVIRQTTFGGADNDVGYDLSQTGDGGYVIIGNSRSSGAGLNDVYVVKTNSLGQFSWSKTYGFAGDDFGYAVAPTRDLGFILAGSTRPVGAEVGDIYMIKAEANGKVNWYRTYGGAGDDVGYAVLRTGDGGYLVAGYTDSFGAGGRDIYLLKTDGSGNINMPVFSNI